MARYPPGAEERGLPLSSAPSLVVRRARVDPLPDQVDVRGGELASRAGHQSGGDLLEQIAVCGVSRQDPLQLWLFAARHVDDAGVRVRLLQVLAAGGTAAGVAAGLRARLRAVVSED